MDTEEIRKYALLMQEMDLSGLEIDEKNGTVRLERHMDPPAGYPVVQTLSAGSQVVSQPQQTAAGSSATPAGPGAVGSTSSADYISVTSPMVGTFYQASEASADPYVKVGDHVDAGSVLCIIEAMKLMNEIPAEISGEVIAVCVSDGQTVEYGTELFRIRVQ